LATVIDELLIKIGFEVQDLESGRKKLSEELDKVRKESDSTGKQMEGSGARAASFFEKASSAALGLIGSLTAVAAGIKATAADIQATVNLAANIGMDPRDLQAIADTIFKIGGSAEGAKASMKGLGEALAAARRGEPISADWVRRMTQIGANQNMSQMEIVKRYIEWFNDPKNKFSNLEKVDVARTLGLSDDFVTLARKGTLGAKDLLEQSKKGDA
jgi:hypothetical protein